jgi:hypothetical protein
MGASFPGLVVVNPYQARTVADLFKRMFLLTNTDRARPRSGRSSTSTDRYQARTRKRSRSTGPDLRRWIAPRCGKTFIERATGSRTP